MQQKKEVKPEEPVALPTTTETSAAAATESPVAAGSEAKPDLDKKRRSSFFNGLGTRKDKKSGEVTSDTEVTEGETKKSPLPQKLGGLFRKPSKAVKAEETKTEPAPTAAGSAPIVETTEGQVASPAKTEPALTNGTSEAPKEPIEPVPQATTGATTEVKSAA
jgi:hypothetical protein